MINPKTNIIYNSRYTSTTVGFINFRPDLLNKYDPDKDINPTSRAWVEGVDNLLDVAKR